MASSKEQDDVDIYFAFSNNQHFGNTLEKREQMGHYEIKYPSNMTNLGI